MFAQINKLFVEKIRSESFLNSVFMIVFFGLLAFLSYFSMWSTVLNIWKEIVQDITLSLAVAAGVAIGLVILLGLATIFLNLIKWMVPKKLFKNPR